MERVFRNKGRETLINRGRGKIGENVLHIKLALYQIYRENSLLKIGRASNTRTTRTIFQQLSNGDDV